MRNVKVLLLAAGFGTRLKELTANTPKPLVSLGKCKLIDCALWQFKQAGIKDLVINLHYKGEQIQKYLGDGKERGFKITYSIENPILGTGGAIKKVLKEDPDKPILVYNSDSVFGSDLNLAEFVSTFLNDERAPIASMLLRTPADPKFGVIRYNQEKITSILDYGKLEEKATDANFCGVHIFSERAKNYILDLPDVSCSIRDLYPSFFKSDELISYQLFPGFFRDTGTVERLQQVTAAIEEGLVSY